MAFDEGLAHRIRDTLGNTRGITERKMFGGLCFMLHGNMFMGVLGSTLMVRVGPVRHAEALAMPHVRAMDFTGRPMKGYVFVDEAGLAEDAQLGGWIAWSTGFARTLPRKAAK